MAQIFSAPLDKIFCDFIFHWRMVEFGTKVDTITKNQEENKMKNGQTSNKDPEMTIIDGMPASVLTGTSKTPQPWED